MRAIDIWKEERDKAEDFKVLKALKGEFVSGYGDTRYTLKMWYPKATKPFSNYYYRSAQQRDDALETAIKNCSYHKEFIEKRRQQRKEKPDEDTLRNRIIKDRLSSIFGRENVSVTQGKGTASGWCHIDINAKSPECNQGHEFACYDCSEWSCGTRQNQIQKLKRKVEEAIKDLHFYTYYDDMNYQHRELIINIGFRKLSSTPIVTQSKKVDDILNQILN